MKSKPPPTTSLPSYVSSVPGPGRTLVSPSLATASGGSGVGSGVEVGSGDRVGVGSVVDVGSGVDVGGGGVGVSLAALTDWGGVGRLPQPVVISPKTRTTTSDNQNCFLVSSFIILVSFSL
jgi:hypothetical protein